MGKVAPSLYGQGPYKGVPDLGLRACYYTESEPGRGCSGKSTAVLHSWVKDKGPGLRVRVGLRRIENELSQGFAFNSLSQAKLSHVCLRTQPCLLCSSDLKHFQPDHKPLRLHQMSLNYLGDVIFLLFPVLLRCR